MQTNPRLAADLGVVPVLEAGHLRGTLLFCGLHDLRTVGASGFPALRTYLWAYTGTRDWTRFSRIDELSVTRQATGDYPPTFITVGDADPFRGQATELAAVLGSRGVPVTTSFPRTLTFLAEHS